MKKTIVIFFMTILLSMPYVYSGGFEKKIDNFLTKIEKLTGKKFVMIDIMRKGGFLMWPLLLCSIISLAVIMERLCYVRKGRILPKREVQKVKKLIEETKDISEVLSFTEGKSSFFTKILNSVLKEDLPRQEMQVMIEDECERALWHINSRTKILSVIAGVSPLLGLMGTVIGMIEAFNVVAVHKGLGKTDLLASGISKALLTTAAGLAIAIPSFIFYHYFIGKAENIIRMLEEELINIVATIKNISLQEDNTETKVE